MLLSFAFCRFAVVFVVVSRCRFCRSFVVYFVVSMWFGTCVKSCIQSNAAQVCSISVLLSSAQISSGMFHPSQFQASSAQCSAALTSRRLSSAQLSSAKRGKINLPIPPVLWGWPKRAKGLLGLLCRPKGGGCRVFDPEEGQGFPFAIP